MKKKQIFKPHQGHRTKVADKFRTSSGLVMFSSDVSARGLDYADVSFVVHINYCCRKIIFNFDSIVD